MKLLIDMNLSPDWVDVLRSNGIESSHWSTVGDPRAKDTELLAYARANDFAVFTHDLDFGTLLALTHARGPSVVQVRAQDVSHETIGPLVVNALRQFESTIESGALITIDHRRMRARILPIGREQP